MQLPLDNYHPIGYNIIVEKIRGKIMKELKEFLGAAGQLNRKELEELSSKILSMLQLTSSVCDEPTSGVGVSCCRKCSSSNILKYGKDKNGKQRYKCKSCNAVFYGTSYSVVSKTRHDLSVWKKYIILLLKGVSLAECARECSISVQTAFTWRHKILHALQFDQSDRMLGGVVEIDDMFFSVNYKGNHKKSKNFVMPRKAYKRGNDNTSAIGSKACVLCACERNGQTYAEVLGTGVADVNKLTYAFKDRLLSDTIALTDKAHGYKNYFDTTSIELVQLSSHSDPKNQNSPPQVLGSYHIQNVNNLHRRIRRSMKNYNGVATKYLNHYINLFVWVENHKKAYEYSLPDEIFKSICMNDSYYSYKNIISLPTIPFVA